MSIKTLSPYYLSIPLTNPLTGVVCEEYQIKLYIWKGSKTAVPVDPEYEITKVNAAMSNGTDKVNIARIANDFIGFDFTTRTTTGLEDGENQVWVKYEVYYNDLFAVASVVGVQLAVKGYGFFLDGENPQLPANKILLSGNDFKVNRDGMFIVPLLASEPTVAARSLVLNTFDRDTYQIYDFTYTANFTFSDLYAFFRNVGDTEWIPEVTSGGSVTVPTTVYEDDFEVRLTAFDVVTGANIISNIVTVTV